MQGFCYKEQLTATHRKEFDYGQQWLIYARPKVTGSDCYIHGIYKQFMMIHTPNKEADSHSSAAWSAKKLATEEEKHIGHLVRKVTG